MRLFLNSEEKRKLDQFDELSAEDVFKSEENHRLATDNRELYLLADGCEKHPGYRAVRQPTATCDQCSSMFAAAQFLRSRGYIALRGRKPGKKAKS